MLPAITKDDTDVSDCPLHKGQRVLTRPQISVRVKVER